jgi:hypothetical protein
MASQHPPTYDDITAHALEQALRDVWEVLKAHDPHHDPDKDRALQMAIADALMALVAAGVSDPHELRSRALKWFDLKPPH